MTINNCGYKKESVGLTGYKKEHCGYKKEHCGYKKRALWDSQATRKGIPRSIGYKGDPTWELPVRLDRNPVLVKLPVRMNENHS